MAKETKLFSVQVQISDRDYDDVFKIYMEQERGKERKIALITSIILAGICFMLMGILHNPSFAFYAGFSLIVGGLYMIVPVNRKFIAQNKLQFGEVREIGFFQHQLSTFEILEDEAELSEEEKEEATTYFSTGNMSAYENERGFLFADGKISNQFLYIPKRKLDAEETDTIRTFAKERCSGGYQYMEMRSMLADPDEEETESEDVSFVDSVCGQYYGADKLHLHDENGRRVRSVDAENADSADESGEAHTEIMDAPEMDVDAELEKILSEDSDE